MTDGRRRSHTASGRVRAQHVVAAFAALAAAGLLLLGIPMIDPGGVAERPQNPAGASGLEAALDYVAQIEVRSAAYMMIIGVVLLLASAVQLASCIGMEEAPTPRAAAFVSATGIAIAVVVAVQVGLMFSLAETAVSREDLGQLYAYYTWEWWAATLIGVLFAAEMATVAWFGVHDIAGPRFVRWGSLAAVVLVLIVTFLGLGGLAMLTGFGWVAALSIGMAIDAAQRETAASREVRADLPATPAGMPASAARGRQPEDEDADTGGKQS